MPVLRLLDLRGGSTRIGDPPSNDVGPQSETPANIIPGGTPPALRRSTALSLGIVVAVVVSLGVGAAGAALAPSLLSTLQSVNSSPNESGVFDNRQKTYNQALYNALQALDQRVTSLEDPPPPPPPPPPPAGEPAPIAGQGYTKRFEDNFDGTTLNLAVWTPHSFWESPEPGSVSVSNGTLKILNNRSGGYRQEISVQSGPEFSGSPSRYDFTYGYAEVRMKFTGGRGSWPAFWLAAVSQSDWANWPNCPKRNEAGQLIPQANYELDIMEHQGDEPNTFYGAQHSNSNGTCGVPDNNSQSVTVNTGASLADEFHVFSVKWTLTEMRWYVDEAQVGETRNTLPESNQRMYILLTMQACGWDSTNSCTTETLDNLITEVDWVRVWRQ